MGLAIGYVAAAAYLKSRVSQLLKNCMRGDAEGLSMVMFLCAIAGNLLGGIGIIVRIGNVSQILWQLPWLIGMLGTVFMDVLLVSQARAAARKSGRVGTDRGEASTQSNGVDAEAPLLSPA